MGEVANVWTQSVTITIGTRTKQGRRVFEYWLDRTPARSRWLCRHGQQVVLQDSQWLVLAGEVPAPAYRGVRPEPECLCLTNGEGVLLVSVGDARGTVLLRLDAPLPKSPPWWKRVAMAPGAEDPPDAGRFGETLFEAMKEAPVRSFLMSAGNSRFWLQLFNRRGRPVLEVQRL
jgi:hypothetical protein